MKNKTDYRSNPVFAASVAVLCTLLWGTAFPAIKIGYIEFGIESQNIPSQLMFAGARFCLAGMIVLFWGFVTAKKDGKMPILHKNDIVPISVLSLFQTYGQYLLLYIGIVNVSGTSSSLYTSAAAFTSVLLSSIVFKGDDLTLKKITGCLIGFIGIVFMISGKTAAGGVTLIGDGLVILSNVFGGIGNVISKKINTGRTPAMVSGWQLLIGGTALLITGAALGGSLIFRSTACVLILLYLGSMAGTAFLLWTMLLFHNPVSKIAVFNLLIPVFGTMWSGIFLGEIIFTLQNGLSLLLVCSGIFLVNSSSAANLKSGRLRHRKMSENKSDQ